MALNIFASALVLFPATLATWFGQGEQTRWLQDVAAALTPGNLPYTIFYASLIIFFCFFYTAIVFNSKETADNLKRYGGFVPGIRPGERTAEYLDYVLTRITVVGAGYLTLICLIPEFLSTQVGIQAFVLGGTSLLIVVNVTIDTVSQIQSHLLAHQYGDLIKKAKLKGGGQRR